MAQDGEMKIPRFAQAEDPDAEDVGDDEIFEFLEGLIEGFRAAAQAAAAESLQKSQAVDEPPKESPKKEETKRQPTDVKDLIKRGGAGGLGAWAELDALGKARQRELEKEATLNPPTPDSVTEAPPARMSRNSEAAAAAPAAAATRLSSGRGSGGYAQFATAKDTSTSDAASAPGKADASLAHRGSSKEQERARPEHYERKAPVEIRGTSAHAALSDTLASVPSTMPGPLDSVSSLMRLHALRSFFEETCGTVANAFDLMASTALRAKGGSGGSAEDRLAYLFHEDEFRNILAGMGYGVDATQAWWKALFLNIDADRDGRISLQDMYDTMVLDLPIIDGDDTNVFFAGR